MKILKVFPLVLSILTPQVNFSFSSITDLPPLSNKVVSSNNSENHYNFISKVDNYYYARETVSSKELFSLENSLTTRQIPGGAKLFKKCSKGVVLLVSPPARSVGSGSIINNKGDILTNWHVVNGVDKLYVAFFDPSLAHINEIEPDNYAVATVIAVDETRDLAIVRLDNRKKRLHVLELGSPYKIDIAMDVFAIGHPEGLIWSFTDGIVSRIRNNYVWSYAGDINMKAKVIQTQTPINPGNSGGPLFNTKGELIGINSFGSTASEGLNFAIHISEINSFISDVSKGKYKYNHKEKSNEDLAEFYEYDTNENGILDARGYPSPETGKIILIVIDKDEDGEFDTIVLDRNEDGNIDCEGYDRDKNGIFEYFIFDDDYNGTFDTVGVDTNGDEEPDSFFAYTG